MAKVLVTGASGCIGSWTTRLLLEQGHEVLAGDISTDMERLNLIVGTAINNPNLRKLALDVCDRDAVEAVIRDEKLDAVIHLAALQIPTCKENPIRCVDVNVRSQMIFLELLRVYDFKYSFASSTAVYGPPIGRSFDEHENIVPATLYGVFKHAEEEMARVYHADYGVNSAGLRPWAVYGPGRDVGLTSDLTVALFNAARGEKFHVRFSGSIGVEHAEEVAQAFIKATLEQKPGAHAYTLGGPVLPVSEMVAIMNELVGRDDLISIDAMPLPVACETSDVSFQRDYGPFEHMDLRQGYRKTLEFWRESGLIGK